MALSEQIEVKEQFEHPNVKLIKVYDKIWGGTVKEDLETKYGVFIDFDSQNEKVLFIKGEGRNCAKTAIKDMTTIQQPGNCSANLAESQKENCNFNSIGYAKNPIHSEEAVDAAVIPINSTVDWGDMLENEKFDCAISDIKRFQISNDIVGSTDSQDSHEDVSVDSIDSNSSHENDSVGSTENSSHKTFPIDSTGSEDVEISTIDERLSTIALHSFEGSAKTIFCDGLSDSDTVDLVFSRCENDPNHTMINTNPFIGSNINLKSVYDNNSGLKATIRKAVKKAQTICEEDPNVIPCVMIHYGRVCFKHALGPIKVSRFSRKSVVYEDLHPQNINTEKLKHLPVENEYTRFELQIQPKDRSIKIMVYKVYAKIINGKATLVDVKETDVNKMEMLPLKVGPGYFCHPEKKCTRVDIIDPSDNITTRVNVSVIMPTETYTQGVQIHLPRLKHFLEGIKVKLVNKKIVFDLPRMNSEYKIIYMRKCERKMHSFEAFNTSFFVRTSQEEIFSGKSRKVIGTGMDLFYHSEALDNTLREKTWGVEKVIDLIENELRFSKTIKHSLLRK